jgi:hypothetical protein
MFIPFAEMKIAPFKTYEEIPVLTREYIVYVAGERDLMNVPLADINSFMAMLYEVETRKRAEYEDGWVI